MRVVLAALLLAACGAKDDPDVVAVLDLTGDATAGADVYADTCGQSSCHGPTGGDGASGVDLAEHAPHHTDYELVDFMLNGVEAMAPVDVTPQEAADVLAYLRETFAEG